PESPGDPPALGSVCPWAARSAARAADSIRRLRLLAARLAPGTRARAGDRVLGGGAGGSRTRPRPAHGQAASGGAELPGRDRGLRAAATAVGPGESPGTAGAGHAVHDTRGRVCGLAAPLHRSGRSPRRDPHLRPHAERDGTTGRVLPQYRRAAFAV